MSEHINGRRKSASFSLDARSLPGNCDLEGGYLYEHAAVVGERQTKRENEPLYIGP
jgi:hypothetical protein